MLKEDQELLSKLRSKYKDGDADDTLSVHQDRGPHASQDTGSIKHVHLCHLCQGSGILTEVYEYRRLESCCSHCQGEGVMLSGAKTSASASASFNSEPATAVAAAGEAKYRKQTERQLLALEQKIAALMQEIEGLRAMLTASSSDLEHRQLQENLMRQVQLHLDHLKVVQSDKRAMLEHQEKEDQ